MADLKISQLPSATTPLAGTEVLPIVQSSATKQVSIANLTAGRSVSVADATLTTGNLVIGISGKGIADSAGAQQMFVNTAGIGIGVAGAAGYKFTTQQNTNDNTLSRHHRANAGGGTAQATQCTQTATGVSTVAATIAGIEDASFIMVRGSDGAGNEFMDLLISNNSGTPTIITSKTIGGSPAARTYSIASFSLKLAMASGTYATNTMWFQLTAR